MKKVLLVVMFVFCVSVNYAQTKDFNGFKRLFKTIELPFVTDSCSIQDLVAQDTQFPRITKRMKNFIPKELQEVLFKEQSVRAYYQIPISDKFVSLLMYAGSLMDGYWVTNSVFYLVNYDYDGNVIDYAKVANFIQESGHSWCTITHDKILYSSYEFYHEPVSFKYDEHKNVPMVESKTKYIIEPNGSFSKKLLFYREGMYEPTYNGCKFEFVRDFPKE